MPESHHVTWYDYVYFLGQEQKGSAREECACWEPTKWRKQEGKVKRQQRHGSHFRGGRRGWNWWGNHPQAINHGGPEAGQRWSKCCKPICMFYSLQLMILYYYLVDLIT